jgi:hypothetical protein
VVLHPPCLERGLLTVVSENEQPAMIGMFDHALREHEHVGNIYRPNGSRRLSVPARGPTARGSAGHAGLKSPDRLPSLLDDE